LHDEPQHIKQGKVTTGLLNVMGINYEVLSKEEDKAIQQITRAFEYMSSTNEVYALVIEKDTFDSYTLQHANENGLTIGREEAITKVAAVIGDKDVVVSTTGMISRELFEYRTSMHDTHERDFLTVGSMGHASQIALGIALEKRDRKVWCFDGDGSCIMHMGSLAIVASKQPVNYVHVVFNNGAHDSVGGQPTVGLSIDLPAIAMAVGYKTSLSVRTMDELSDAIKNVNELKGPVFLQICVRKGNRKDLGRPNTSPLDNKKALMNFLNDER
jgi:phosphonopyruvate decarboxylase